MPDLRPKTMNSLIDDPLIKASCNFVFVCWIHLALCKKERTENMILVSKFFLEFTYVSEIGIRL